MCANLGCAAGPRVAHAGSGAEGRPIALHPAIPGAARYWRLAYRMSAYEPTISTAPTMTIAVLSTRGSSPYSPAPKLIRPLARVVRAHDIRCVTDATDGGVGPGTRSRVECDGLAAVRGSRRGRRPQAAHRCPPADVPPQ